MTNKTFRFDFSELNLSIPQIESVMGYKDGEDSFLVRGLIEEILHEVASICNVRAQYTLFSDISFISGSNSLIISDNSFNLDKIVYGQVKKSDMIAVFMCTAGPEIGLRSRKAMGERDMMTGYVYDIIGSEIAEAAADLMQNDLERQAIDAGRRITNRYSPGYCGWNVSEQHKLFGLVPDNFCGIKLTPSALMDPVKSVSGIIGVGASVRFNPYTCRMCSQDDCIYRRIKESKVTKKAKVE